MLQRSRMLETAGRPRVIVAGTRTFDDWRVLYDKMDKIIQKLTNPIICTGAAKGADRIAEEWALRRKFLLSRFHADWDKHGKAAGPIRNKEMIQYACERRPAFLVAFWDGKSPGTKNCIEQARKAEMKIRVVYY